MKKRNLMVAVFAASVAFTFNAEARVDRDLALGKTPSEAASSAFARGENPGQISRALKEAGVSRAVAANVVATAPRRSYGARPGNDERGRGFDLSQAIHRFKELHDHRHGELARFIKFFKAFAGWHHHHPGGPSPC